MKIVIIDTTIHDKLIGGGHLYLPNLINGLVDKGNEVYLVVDGTPNDKVLPQLQASGAIICDNIWKKKGRIEEMSFALASWVNNLQPAIYLISASADIGWVALPYIDPQIATLGIGHTDSETFYLPIRHYHSFLTRAIGVSTEVCDQYVSSCHLSADKVDWIPYGVQGSSIVSQIDKDGMLQLIYVGRIEETQKRISDLIKITQGLTAENINYHLKIIGDGPEMPLLEAELVNEIKAKKVQLFGWVSSTEVLNQLRQSEIFVLTSAYEGFCIALIEAMANGCCPVVTDIRSGNKQMIDQNQNGFMIEIGRTDLFIEKLKMLLQHPDELMSLRKAAWNRGQQYTINRMVEKYEENFSKAILQVKQSPRNTDDTFPLMSTCQSKYPFWLRKLRKMVSRES